MSNTETNDADTNMANGEPENKASEPTNMSSFVIEEVTITVKNMDTTDAERENVSILSKR